MNFHETCRTHLLKPRADAENDVARDHLADALPSYIDDGTRECQRSTREQEVPADANFGQTSSDTYEHSCS
jgi:hypothetical protein